MTTDEEERRGTRAAAALSEGLYAHITRTLRTLGRGSRGEVDTVQGTVHSI